MLRRVRSLPYLPMAVLALALAGCAPKIGDKCKNSGDCSLDGTRICDTAQPGGYCTIQGCDPDSCPGGSVCVEWRYDPPRTAQTYCMRTCRSDSACRSDYSCVTTENPALRSLIDGTCLARVIDLEFSTEERSEVKFCAATGNEEVPDGSVPSSCDAGTPDAGPDAGSGPVDAGVDGGSMDAGPDAGPVDAGP